MTPYEGEAAPGSGAAEAGRRLDGGRPIRPSPASPPAGSAQPGGPVGAPHSLLDRIVIVPQQGSFVFRGETYAYFHHPYNHTWAIERAVEVPMVRRLVERASPHATLEVGNVLGHYFPRHHDVVDRFETGDGVVNQDVIEYRPDKRYELIVSISTLEHVGWDDHPRDPNKVLQAVRHLASLLTPTGTLLFTAAVGYSPFLDELAETGEPAEVAYRCMKRVSSDNRWVEATWNEVRGSKYDFPYPGANGLLIGTLHRSP